MILSPLSPPPPPACTMQATSPTSRTSSRPWCRTGGPGSRWRTQVLAMTLLSRQVDGLTILAEAMRLQVKFWGGNTPGQGWRLRALIYQISLFTIEVLSKLSNIEVLSKLSNIGVLSKLFTIGVL